MTFPYVNTPIPVVLVDANVLYSRVLRDYLLCAAEQELINVNWSQSILDDVSKHLMRNLPAFSVQSAEVLQTALLAAFPYALVEPGSEDYAYLENLVLPDEEDREVIASALTAQAEIICTNNIKHFPPTLLEPLGINVMTPDDLLMELIQQHQRIMMTVHSTVVASLAQATDESTVNALQRARAIKTSAHLASLLELS